MSRVCGDQLGLAASSNVGLAREEIKDDPYLRAVMQQGVWNGWRRGTHGWNLEDHRANTETPQVRVSEEINTINPRTRWHSPVHNSTAAKMPVKAIYQ